MDYYCSIGFPIVELIKDFFSMYASSSYLSIDRPTEPTEPTELSISHSSRNGTHTSRVERGVGKQVKTSHVRRATVVHMMMRVVMVMVRRGAINVDVDVDVDSRHAVADRVDQLFGSLAEFTAGLVSSEIVDAGKASLAPQCVELAQHVLVLRAVGGHVAFEVGPFAVQVRVADGTVHLVAVVARRDVLVAHLLVHERLGAAREGAFERSLVRVRRVVGSVRRGRR